MSGITKLESAVKSEAEAVARGFDSLGARIKSVEAKFVEAIGHPFTPAPLKTALPDLMGILEDLRQELAEQRKPCPCEGSAGTAATLAVQTVAQLAAAPAAQASAALAPPPAPADQAQQQNGTGA